VLTCLSRGAGVQAEAIFDVRALLTPPLAAERMIRLSSNGFSCRNACLTENALQSLADLNEGKSPTFEMLKRMGAASDWPLEIWAADLLLTCQVGQQFDDSRDDRVRYFLERRSGPIGAALAVSITLPEGSAS
jgi:hypothetical protein